jgi:hypothetical protein
MVLQLCSCVSSFFLLNLLPSSNVLGSSSAFLRFATPTAKLPQQHITTSMVYFLFRFFHRQVWGFEVNLYAIPAFVVLRCARDGAFRVRLSQQ